MTRRRLAPALAGAGLLALTACGTTVSTADVASSGSTDLGGAATSDLSVPGTAAGSGPGAGAAASLPGVGSETGGSTAGASSVAVGTSAGAPGDAAPGGNSPASARAASSSVIGVTANEITVGFRYYTDDSAFAESLGMRGAQNGDEQGYAKAVVADLNAHGGVAGRKLSVVYSGETAQDSIYNADGSDQAACATFTQDNHVFAALSVGQGKVLHACMSQHHVPFVEDNIGLFDLTKPELAYNYFVPSYPTGPRSMQLLVDSLYTTNWFGAKPTIGAVESDKENRASSVVALKQALAAHGLQLKANVAYATPQQLSEALLQMQADGVDRLFVVEGSNGLETEVVMTQAQSQHYFPRYAIDTRSGPSFLQLNAPPQQLSGAAGVGWFPMYDVGTDDSSLATHCLDVIHKAGVTTPDPLAVRFALSTCDVFDFFRTVLERSAGISSSGFIDAAGALGGAFRPVGTFRSFFTPTRHDGTSAYRQLVYADECRCFRYRGSIQEAR